MNTLLALARISGLASSYGGPAHVGQPLYCDRGHGLVYDETLPPWVAIDAAAYITPKLPHSHTPTLLNSHCGDYLAIHFTTPPRSHTLPHSHSPTLTPLHAQALDAGHLARHGIVVDIPFHLAPFPVETGVVPVTVINYSLLRRALE